MGDGSIDADAESAWLSGDAAETLAPVGPGGAGTVVQLPRSRYAPPALPAVLPRPSASSFVAPTPGSAQLAGGADAQADAADVPTVAPPGALRARAARVGAAPCADADTLVPLMLTPPSPRARAARRGATRLESLLEIILQEQREQAERIGRLQARGVSGNNPRRRVSADVSLVPRRWVSTT
jgi:hypothetical protein